MKTELTLENAPRDIPALLGLDPLRRIGLFQQLCKKMSADLPPGEKHFLRLSEAEQAIVLAHFLATYDTSHGSVSAVGVPMPVRSRIHATNVKRMHIFAKELGDRINSVRQRGEKYELLLLNGVGVVVLGEKERQLQMQPVVVAIPSSPPDTPDEPQTAAVERLKKIMLKMQYLQMKDLLSDSAVKGILVDELIGLSPEHINDIRAAIVTIRAQHKTVCDDSACTFNHALTLVEASLAASSITQQN